MDAQMLAVVAMLLIASALLLARACVDIFAERKPVDALFPAAMGIGILWEACQPHPEMKLSYALILLGVAVVFGGLPLLGWIQRRREAEAATEDSGPVLPENT